MDRQRVWQLINAERDRQEKKWAGQGDGESDGEDARWVSHPLYKLAVLTEEVGEVAKDLQERGANGVRDELVQVAAVCVRWLQAFVAPEDDPETCLEKQAIRQLGSTGPEMKVALEQIWEMGGAHAKLLSPPLQSAIMIAGKALGKVAR